MGIALPSPPCKGLVVERSRPQGGGPTPTPPTLVTPPVVSGAFDWGSALTTTDGTWTESPTGYTYQWYRGATPIAGATSNTYVLDTPDFAHEITCQVTASNGAGSSAPEPSNAMSSPYRLYFFAKPTARLWDHRHGITTAVGLPVASWRAHNGPWALEQLLTSQQPLREAGGVRHDGIDDFLRGDTSTAALCAGDCEIVSLVADVTLAGTSARTHVCVNQDSSVNASQNIIAKRWGGLASSGLGRWSVLTDGPDGDLVSLNTGLWSYGTAPFLTALSVDWGGRRRVAPGLGRD